MFKVLNTEGEVIVVSKIDITKHRHLSGREFTTDDACVNIVSKEPVKTENEQTTEMTREQAIEAYTAKYGKKPSNLTKTETIISKL